MGVTYKCIYCGKRIKCKSKFIGDIEEFNKFTDKREKELSDECECQKNKEKRSITK